MIQDSINSIRLNCLQSPLSSSSWSLIGQIYPHIKDLLVDYSPLSCVGTTQATESLLDVSQVKTEQGEAAPTLPIQWHVVTPKGQDKSRELYTNLQFFDYDCSSVSPFVSNVYRREWSNEGWYRWIGPQEELAINVPIDLLLASQWKLTVVIHAFASEENCANLKLLVGSKQYPLSWVEDKTYTCQFESLGVEQPKRADKTNPYIKISLSAPPVKSPSANDHRLISFAIRRITLIPAS